MGLPAKEAAPVTRASQPQMIGILVVNSLGKRCYYFREHFDCIPLFLGAHHGMINMLHVWS